MKQFKRDKVWSTDGNVRRSPDTKPGSRRREEADGSSLPAVRLVTSEAAAGAERGRVESVAADVSRMTLRGETRDSLPCLLRRWVGLTGVGLALLSAQAATDTVGQAKVAGGGGAGTGGQFALRGTAGQADAHAVRSAGAFTLSGGLWARPRFSVSNRLPVAGSDLVVRLDDALFAKIPVATLLGNDVDPDGDPLSFTGVADALPAGATVVMIGPWVIYTAPAVEAGAGSFTYTLSDGPGGHSATGFVTVSVAAAPEPDGAPNPVSVSTSGNDFAVSFLGVPGYRYRVQFSSDVAPPCTWREFDPPAVYTAPETGAAGLFRHVDPNPPDALRLYRAVPEP